MPLIPNQIHKAIDTATNGERKTATPYELKSLAGAPIQKIATLKDSFSKLNPNSITDYLTSIGEDPSIQNRQALGAKYNIQGIGTAEGNTALLNALKGGQTPVQIPKVEGTVAGAIPATPIPDTTPAPATPIGGTVAGAVNQPDTTTSSMSPEVESAKSTSETSKRAVLGVTKRIDEINTSVDRTLQDKRDEIARSGGVVNESQLRSTVLAELAPLLLERKDLLSQRAQLVGEQNIAEKNYNDMVNQEYKNQQLAISQEKVNQTGEKMNIQQDQFAQKLEQTGWKSSKVNVYDPAGNVIGQKIVWEENPATANISGSSSAKTIAPQGLIDFNQPLSSVIQNFGIDNIVNNIIKNEGSSPAGVKNNPGNIKYVGQAGATDSRIKATDGGTFANFATKQAGKDAITGIITRASQGRISAYGANPTFQEFVNKYTNTVPTSNISGISDTGVTTMGNTKKLPTLTLADGATPQQVLQSLTSGDSVYIKGSTTPLSQQDLYFLAIQDMLGATSTVGGRTPSGAILSVKDKETQIANAYGLTPFDISIAKTQFKNLGSANLQLLQTASFIKTYGSTAIDNLQLALSQSDKVARSGAKIVNHFSQWMQGNFTPAGNLAEFETYIYTASREYAKVTSGGAKSAQALTDSAQRQVDELINASQSPQVFKQVTDAMKADMANVIGNFDKQTNSFPDAIKALYGMAGKPPDLMRSSVSDASTFVEKSLTRQGYHYDTFMKEMNANIPAGTQPALNNETGATVYATPEEIKNGLATPL